MSIDAIGAFLNILLIIAFVVDPLKLLRKGAWITIINLAFADLIACVSNFFDVGLIKELGMADSTTFIVVRFFLIFGVSASFILLTLLTVEAYVVTKYPIRGRLMLTEIKTAMFCLIVWLLAVPCGLSNIAYLFTRHFELLMKVYIAQMAVLELAAVIQVILKILIIREIMKSQRDLTEHQNNRHIKEVAKTIIILNVILMVTAFPYFVAKQLEFLWKLRHISGDPLLWRFSNYYEPIAAINYVANPILYSLRLPDYRRTLFEIFHKCKRTGLRTSGTLRWNKSTMNADAAISFSISDRDTTTEF